VGRGQRLGGNTGISNITNSPRQTQTQQSTYDNMMTKAREAGQYIKDTTEKTVEAIKGKLKRGPTKVPKSDNISYDDPLQETKTNAAIQETKPQTIGSNIHTLNTNRDGTAQMLVFNTGPRLGATVENAYQ